jgi:hypothetical protein
MYYSVYIVDIFKDKEITQVFDESGTLKGMASSDGKTPSYLAKEAWESI